MGVFCDVMIPSEVEGKGAGRTLAEGLNLLRMKGMLGYSLPSRVLTHCVYHMLKEKTISAFRELKGSEETVDARPPSSASCWHL